MGNCYFNVFVKSSGRVHYINYKIGVADVVAVLFFLLLLYA